jgi:hypothetical protein
MPAAERSVRPESVEQDRLLALAIGELKMAVDAISAYAALLDAQTTTPALSALRDSVAEVREQTEQVAGLLATELDGAAESW